MFTQARKLLNLSRRASEPGVVVILCGDFNVEPKSETLAILAEGGPQKLVTGRGFHSTRSRHYKKHGRFADYMLINREEVVKSFDVIRDPEVSDHCPLLLAI